MNRRQRRSIEKDLGIQAHKRKMTYKERIKSIQQGVQAGKERSIDAQENRKRQENAGRDAQISQETSSLATTIMIRDGLSWHEANEAAKREIAERYTGEEEL